jgi:hemerythrin-like domain-containing protein
MVPHMAELSVDRAEMDEESAAAHDPVLNLRRDHTLLQMLGEAYHRLATELRAGGTFDRERVEEGIRLHDQFLIETHHRKEELLDQHLDRSGGRKYSKALDECRREHEAARRAAEKIHREFDRAVRGEEGAVQSLAYAMEGEADRWMNHLRREEEQLYGSLHLEIPRDLRTELSNSMRRIRMDTAALEERLTSWTSRWGPASD